MIEASIYNKCVRCGLCLPSCPTYLETMTETSGPRGRISLIKAVDEERLDLLSPAFVHQMSECLDCRACAAVCPSGVQYGDLVEGARARIEHATAKRRSALKGFLRRFFLRTLFEHGWLMRAAARLLRFAQRSGLQRLAMRSGVAAAFNLQEAANITLPLSPVFFAPRNQRFTGKGDAQRTVFFHTGCVMQVAFAHWHEASIRVLRRNNCTVIVPADQGCCGAIAVHAGDVEFGERLAKRNIAAFERSNADYYVVNAAGCGSALKEYATLLGRDPHWADRAERFSACVRDILEFLDEVGVKTPTAAVGATVTYQDACHLAHAQRVTEAPRRLLRSIPGLTLCEMNESAVCCGSAGIYNLTQPEMAARLGERKAKNVIASRADIVATSNPGCALQMASHLRTLETPTPIKHVVELLDEAYAASDGRYQAISVVKSGID